MVASSSEQYALFFDGPADDSADTLRRLKASFLADLELAISDIQRALNDAPLPILFSKERIDLERLCGKLNAAGGLARVVPYPEEPPAREPSNGDVALVSMAPSTPLPALDAIWDQEEETTTATQSTVEEATPPHTEEDQSDEETGVSGEEEEVTVVFDLDDLEAQEQLEPEKPTPNETKRSVAWTLDLPPELESLLLAEEENADIPPASGYLEDAATETEEELGDVAGLIPETLTPTPLSYAQQPANPRVEEDPLLMEDPQAELQAPQPAAPGRSQSSEMPGLTLALEEPEESSPQAFMTNSKEDDEPTLPATAEQPLENGAETTKIEPSEYVSLVGGPATLVTAQDNAKLDEAEEENYPDFISGQDDSTPSLASLIKNKKSEPAAGEEQDEEEYRKKSLLSSRTHAAKKLTATNLTGLLACLVLTLGILAWWTNPFDPNILDVTTFGPTLEANLQSQTSTMGDSEQKGVLTLSGHRQENEFALNATCFESALKQISCSIVASTPEPPELTPEEIVVMKVRRPWLRRIEITKEPLQAMPDGSLEARGQARVYLEYKSQRGRIAAHYLMRLRKDSEGLTTLTFGATTLGTENTSQPLLFEARKDGRFNLRFVQDVVLNPVTSTNENAPVPEASGSLQPEVEEPLWNLP